YLYSSYFTYRVACPGFQSAAQNPPVCIACSTRKVSSTDRPVFIAWTTEYCSTPLGSIMYSPRSAILGSSRRMLYTLESLPPESDASGNFRPSMPFCERGVLIHARCEWTESVETPRTSAPRPLIS